MYLSEETEPHRYHGIYEIKPQSLRAFALQVAQKVRRLGEDSVRVIGDPERFVSRPAIGVGCAGPDREAVARGADVCVVCYDGAAYWAVRERLAEMGAAVLTVEHGTSEMPGMEAMCVHFAQRFPEIDFQYFAAHPCPWTVQPA